MRPPHDPAASEARPAPPGPVPLPQALAYWLRLGCISFGGPAGQIALMHAELVERRRWISERRFFHALNYCMVLPGPEAQQLATYLGWLMHGRWGGLLAGGLFVLPSLLLLVALSWIYLRHGSQPLVAGVLAGIQPAVVALVAVAALRIGRRSLRDPLWIGIAVAAFLALELAGLPFVLIVAGAAASGTLALRWRPQALHAGSAAEGGAALGAPPAWIDDDSPPPRHAQLSLSAALGVLACGLALGGAGLGLLAGWGGTDGLLVELALFFTQAALLSFGGAYAVLPFLVQGAVEQHGWLTALQMLDGLALGESTPGPLIMVVAYIGFLAGAGRELLGPDTLFLSGLLAATVATAYTFLPSFVFIFLGAPFIERSRGRLGVIAPLAGIHAAVVGVIASLALFFARQVIWPAGSGFDAVAAALALLYFGLLARGWIGVLPLIALAGTLGALRSLLA
ncbi:chromate efflux transporter [Piscinibacter sp. Jin2]|uniref:Chromate efflux transporter n=1 Tax=Aquariibacter lacus TaxID=2801332 RepID=A0A9X0XDI4_9BURK|nr:chromate efflux transporter [Piscinibacter lacus]MBL0719033.1 chromate efflux transporter [Piscinibacter lacus]